MSKKVQNTEVAVINTKVADKVCTDDGAINELKNVELRKHVRTFVESGKKTQKAFWDMNKAIALIMENEEFKQDFGTDKEFARFMGISCATLSKMKRVGAITVGTAGLDQLGYTVAQAEELLPLVKDNLVNDFFESVKPCPDMTRDEIRTLVKEYRNGLLTTEDESEMEETGEEVYAGTDSLENYDDTDTDEYIYTIPVMTTDGAIDATIVCKGFTAMEILAKAINNVLMAHEGKIDIIA